jgi:hypothetical protein
VIIAVDGAMMAAAAVGVPMLVHRLGRQSSFWVPLALARVAERDAAQASLSELGVVRFDHRYR